jgi:hypothetical protein
VALTANPSVPLRSLIVVVAGVCALFCALQPVLVILSFFGVVPFDMNLLFVALPAVVGAVLLWIVARSSLRLLLMPRPVLSANESGILDRRIMPALLPWSDVSRVTSIVGGGGGVVLDLREPAPMTDVGSWRFEVADNGAAHIMLGGLTDDPATLARGILDLAARAGVETVTADAHEKVRRRTWSV